MKYEDGRIFSGSSVRDGSCWSPWRKRLLARSPPDNYIIGRYPSGAAKIGICRSAMGERLWNKIAQLGSPPSRCDPT
jgi:hypothetical protein